MTLLVFRHDQRVTSPAEAAELFRALGSKLITTEGWVARDRTTIDPLIRALGPHRDDSLSITGGTLTAVAYAALPPLALARPSYIELTTHRGVELQIWPDRDPFGDVRDAIDRFYVKIAGPLKSGTIMNPTLAALDLLPPLLHAIGGEVSARLAIAPAAAAQLADRLGHDTLAWQSELMKIELATGEITKYATRATEHRIPKWRIAVDKALAKIRAERLPRAIAKLRGP
jgi:hypothetical protein